MQQIYRVFILQIYLFHDGCSYNELIHDISMIKISRITAQKHITSGLNRKKPNLSTHNLLKQFNSLENKQNINLSPQSFLQIKIYS